MRTKPKRPLLALSPSVAGSQASVVQSRVQWRAAPTLLAALVVTFASITAGAREADAGAALRLEAEPDAGALKLAAHAASEAVAGGHVLSHPSVFASQSFRILDHGEPAGTLVSGRGTLPALSHEADPVNTCFVSFVKAGKSSAPVLTVGVGAWETEGCSGVAAVGLLPESGPTHRVAIIYRASAPHTAPLEPVVLEWSQQQTLAIDGEASKKASLAGATTLAEVRAAVH